MVAVVVVAVVTVVWVEGGVKAVEGDGDSCTAGGN